MDIKELGLEVKESRIEGILREIKEEIGKKDIRFIKLTDIHGRDIYISTLMRLYRFKKIVKT